MAWSRRRVREEAGAFLRQYRRPTHPGHDPNDRGYNRELERAVKRLPPEELDRIMNGDPDEDDDDT